MITKRWSQKFRLHTRNSYDPITKPCHFDDGRLEHFKTFIVTFTDIENEVLGDFGSKASKMFIFIHFMQNESKFGSFTMYFFTFCFKILECYGKKETTTSLPTTARIFIEVFEI